VRVRIPPPACTTEFTSEDHQEAWSSFRHYQDGADFADSSIAAVNRRHGCERTVTFDRKAAKRSDFVVL